MGWFDEQIRERKRQDNERFADAIDEISSIISKVISNITNKIPNKTTTKIVHLVLIH